MTRFSLTLVVILLVSSSFCRASEQCQLKIQTDAPAEAEPAIRFLLASANGNILSVIDELFDYDGFLLRMGGQDYQKLSPEEKRYAQQLLSVFLKSLYRHYWFQFSIQKSRFYDVQVEKNIDNQILIIMKRDFLGDVKDFAFLLDKINGESRIIDIRCIEEHFVSEIISMNRKLIVENAPADLKDQIDNLTFLDFLEITALPHVADYFDLDMKAKSRE